MNRFQDKSVKFTDDPIISSRTYFTDNEMPTVTDRTYSRSITPNLPLQLPNSKYILSFSNKLLKVLHPDYTENLFNFSGKLGVQCLFNHDGYTALDKREDENKKLRKQFRRLRKRFGKGIVQELYDKRIQWDEMFKDHYEILIQQMNITQGQDVIQLEENSAPQDECIYETRILKYEDRISQDTDIEEPIPETRILKFEDKLNERLSHRLRMEGRKSEVMPLIKKSEISLPLGLPPLPYSKRKPQKLSESIDQGYFTLRGEEFIDNYLDSYIEGSAEVPPTLSVKSNINNKTKRIGQSLQMLDWKSVPEKEFVIRGGKFRDGPTCGIAVLKENEILQNNPRLNLDIPVYDSDLELNVEYEIDAEWSLVSRPVSPDFRRLGFFEL